MTPTESFPHRYKSHALSAYARALSADPTDFTPAEQQTIIDSLIGHTHTDEEAADLADLTLEQLHHDCTTLSAADGLPMIIVSPNPDSPGYFYFSRPLQGWPKPHVPPGS